MKKLLIVAVAVVMVMGLAGSAFATNSLKMGSKGISIGTGSSIAEDYGGRVIDLTGRYMINTGLALLGGFGLESHGGDADGTYIALSVGIRSYLKVDAFAPFIQGRLRFETQDVVGDTDAFDISAGFGAEYFLHRQFSVEGYAGIGLGTISDNIANADDIYFGTRTVGLYANFYF